MVDLLRKRAFDERCHAHGEIAKREVTILRAGRRFAVAISKAAASARERGHRSNHNPDPTPSTTHVPHLYLCACDICHTARYDPAV